ncbi:hypothetical protein SUGI_0750250 [Cryptomeria japonica]|nr:hypothetical protein SUGI_0750250 [Cryptomeria japonica]
MEERKDAGLSFSSTPEITESQIMQAERVQGIISQHSEATGSPEIKFSANKFFQIQGSGTTDNFPTGRKPINCKLHAKDEASMELKSLDVNSNEPRSLDKLYAGSPGEMSLRKGIFPEGNCHNYEEQLGALDNNKFSDELRGKSYEQYREKREAKLREEHSAKKSEKEAKLKAMQEVLEQRKTEMAGKCAKSSVK